MTHRPSRRRVNLVTKTASRLSVSRPTYRVVGWVPQQGAVAEFLAVQPDCPDLNRALFVCQWDGFVGWLVAYRPSNMLVYLRDGSAQTSLRAATLRQKLRIKLSTPPSHSILTPGRPIPSLTLFRQAPGRVATRVPIFKSLAHLTRKSPVASGIRTRDLPLSRRSP